MTIPTRGPNTIGTPVLSFIWDSFPRGPKVFAIMVEIVRYVKKKFAGPIKVVRVKLYFKEKQGRACKTTDCLLF